ncbi:hypothetical protein OPV22_013146 [Ensete ventricosum]|uniref:DUF4005 domain-containing protein n=1 Tax=Ensete ventricosum TaxID=4639 RepID=A0AAV8R7M0_ENSVE|nr:hypothetical protein OPV22_013146 [Ensete ventricosum]
MSKSDMKPSFRKPTSDTANRKDRCHSPVYVTNPRREHDRSPSISRKIGPGHLMSSGKRMLEERKGF